MNFWFAFSDQNEIKVLPCGFRKFYDILIVFCKLKIFIFIF